MGVNNDSSRRISNSRWVLQYWRGAVQGARTGWNSEAVLHSHEPVLVLFFAVSNKPCRYLRLRSWARLVFDAVHRNYCQDCEAALPRAARTGSRWRRKNCQARSSHPQPSFAVTFAAVGEFGSNVELNCGCQVVGTQPPRMNAAIVLRQGRAAMAFATTFPASIGCMGILQPARRLRKSGKPAPSAAAVMLYLWEREG